MQSNQSVPISDIFFLTLRKWPWILLSLLIFIGGALVYILRTPTVYTRAAEIMIKDTSKGKSVGVEDFSDFGLVSSNTDVENEITNLKSPDLMAQVVKRLNLDINYFRDGRFHNTVAYGKDLPIKVKLFNFPENGSAQFDIDVAASGNVKISSLAIGDDAVDGSFTGRIGDSISTPVGKMVIEPTPLFVPQSTVSLMVEKMPMETAQASYSSRLGVSKNSDNTNVIRLTLSDQSIERADDVLSTLIDVYKESWIRDKNEIAVSTSQFITDRLGVIEDELGNVDDDISSFKSEHLIPDVDAASSMYMNQDQQYQTEILNINNQLQLARFVRSYLTSDGSHNIMLPANSDLVGDIAAQVGQYNEKILNRNALAAKSSETNPLVKTLDEELSSMRNAMIATVNNHITALNTQLQSLQSTQAATRSKIATSPSQAKYLLSVERQQKVKESLYLFLLQKREENELTQAFSAYNTRVVSRPGYAGVPPTPAKTMILLIAGLLGLALPFGVVFVMETSNTRIRGRKDIESLSLPFLGEIPQDETLVNRRSRSKDRERNPLVVKEGKRDIINEAFRVIRTNVDFMRVKTSGANVISVTSFNPGSGKSFVSINLAKTMALKHKKVLVIDGDMRHGSTSAYIGSPEIGLANYLSSPDPDPFKYIDAADSNLEVFPVGTIPPNPTELLESSRFGELIEKLRPHYDYIFIDCPPIEIVADAQIIDRYVDRTVFIIRAGLLERVMLPELERIYDEKKYHNMALILNGTPLSRSRYGYSHGYRYGYGYGYGYGYNYGSKSEDK